MIDVIEGSEGFDPDADITLYRAKLYFDWSEEADKNAIEFDLEVNGEIEDRAEFIIDLIGSYGGVAEIRDEGVIVNLNEYKYATIERVSDMESPSDHVGRVLH